MEFGTLKLSGHSPCGFDMMLPREVQVAETFRLLEHPNPKLD
jgi:hypothetical protein